MASSVFSSDKEIEQRLLEIGNRLQEPPNSVDELLSLLDQAEHFLAKVEQSPPKSLQNALLPSRQSLVSDQLFKHTNADVKVAVAACISEITRITAPDAPYDDEEMKDVFKLIVSSFQNLADKASRSYTKRTSILETVAKVRSCVVMLDLECDALINEMFEHFLKAIRDDHPGNVFSSMETIMILVVEESEDISIDLLSSILNCVRKTNEDVMPIARKLAERVLESCAAKIKPYLIQAVKSLGISLEDYSTIVASICEETSGAVEKHNVLSDEHVADDSNVTRVSMDEAAEVEESNIVRALVDETAKVDEKNSIEVAPTQQVFPPLDMSLKLAVSNGVKKTTEDHSVVDSNSIKKQEKDQIMEQSESIDGNMDNEKEVNADKNEEQTIRKRGRKSISPKLSESSDAALANDEKESETLPEKNDGKNQTMSPCQDSSVEANLSFDNGKEIDINTSSPTEIRAERTNIASPSPSGSLRNENRSKRTGRQKKDNSMKQAEASVDDANKKSFDVSSDSEDKPIKLSGKKVKPGVSNKDQTKNVVEASKKSCEASTLSGVRRKKRSVKKITSGTTNVEEIPIVAEASKKEGDIASDSEAEAEPVTPKEKVDDSDSDAEEPLKQTIVKRKRTQGKSISKKDSSKMPAKDDDKETIPSPKSAKVSTKIDKQLEDTPATNSKRKRTPGKEPASGKEYGEEIIGSRVKVWWPQDHSYYTGVVRIFDPVKKKHKVFYDDGDVENLNLQRQKWEFIDRDSESVEVDGTDGPSLSDSSGESPVKKAKSNSDELTKHGKTESSTKRSGASSSKSKVAPKKSNNKKSKEEVNVEKTPKVSSKDHASAKPSSKSVDVASKPSNKSKNVDNETPKSGKSKDVASKTTIKSKEESSKTSKSKQETPKVSSISKGKSSKSGTKSIVNSGGKSKSGSSKTKNVEDTKEDSSDMDKTLENTKGKSASTSKAQGSDAKSGKKRRR